MTLGELRLRLGVPLIGLAARLKLTDQALGKLEATAVHRASVGAFANYAAGIGARVVVVVDDGSHVEIKP
jgi:hypothetical protein